MLEKILASEAFAYSGRTSRFLRFAVEQRLQDPRVGLKEHLIAVFRSEEDRLVIPPAALCLLEDNHCQGWKGDSDRIRPIMRGNFFRADAAGVSHIVAAIKS